MCNLSCEPCFVSGASANRRLRAMALCAAAFLLVSTFGCGTGEYNDRAEQRLQELQGLSKYLEYLDNESIDVSDVQMVDGEPQVRKLGVILQLPKDIISQGKPLRVGYMEDNVEVDERRVKPPFLMGLRDFCLSYELLVPNPNTRQSQHTELPIYVYFAVSRADSVDQEELLKEIRTALVDARTIDDQGNESKTFSVVPEDWQPVTLPEKDGQPWMRLQLEGKQYFAAVPREITMDGRFDIYVHSGRDYHVVVAFRAPSSVDDERDFMTAGQIALETLKIDPPADLPEGSTPAGDAAAGESS